MALSKFTKAINAADGSDFMVSLPVSQADDQYGVFPTQSKGVLEVGIMVPDEVPGDRSVSDFRVVLTAAMADGSELEFIVVGA